MSVYTKDPVRLCHTVTFEEEASWLDGAREYYDLDKDSRPDFNPYDFLNDSSTYCKLVSLASRKTSPELNELIDQVKGFYEFADKFANHVLGKLIQEQYKP